RQVEFLQPRDLAPERGLVGQVGERCAAPEREGLRERGGGLGGGGREGGLGRPCPGPRPARRRSRGHRLGPRSRRPRRRSDRRRAPAAAGTRTSAAGSLPSRGAPPPPSL